MTYIPEYARTNNRAMITAAFSPKTLMGLQGCGCSGAADPNGVMRNLAGLSAVCEQQSEWELYKDGEICLNVCKTDRSQWYTMDPSQCADAKPAATTSGACDDTSLWKVGRSGGKCFTYCGADATQYHEVDDSFCVSGKPPGGSSKVPTEVWVLAAVGAGLLMMAVTQ